MDTSIFKERLTEFFQQNNIDQAGKFVADSLQTSPQGHQKIADAYAQVITEIGQDFPEDTLSMSLFVIRAAECNTGAIVSTLHNLALSVVETNPKIAIKMITGPFKRRRSRNRHGSCK